MGIHNVTNGRWKLLLLVLILLGLIITASLVSAGEVSYITNPQTGELIGVVDDTGTYIIYSAPDGTAMFVTDQDGNVVYTREIDFDGVILSESGEDMNGVIDRSIGWDEDIQEYLRSDGTVDFSTDGVFIGLHWGSFGRVIGPTLRELGTLGLYSAIQDYNNDYLEWGDVVNHIPIVGGIKAAFEAENGVDRASAILTTAGGTGLIVAGGMAAAGKSKVFYVDPNGVTIVSKRGVPSAGAFGKGVAGGSALATKTKAIGDAALLKLWKGEGGEIPMDPARFERIVKRLREQGAIVHVVDQEVIKNVAGADAGAAFIWSRRKGVSSEFYFKRNPSNAEVFEELLHNADARKGRMYNAIREYDNEYSAKDALHLRIYEKMLKNKKVYSLSDADVKDYEFKLKMIKSFPPKHRKLRGP